MKIGAKVKIILVAFIVLTVGFALLGWWFMFSDILMDKYATFDSPDKKFQVVVMRNKQLLGISPGQAGDAPGEARLYNSDGDLLEKADVEMVQMVENVEWREDSVYIKFVAEWQLPK